MQLELIKEQKPDGIFCLYDYAAISVMKAVLSLGLSIPNDIALIGYDNINISNYCINTAGGLTDEESSKFYNDIDPLDDGKTRV